MKIDLSMEDLREIGANMQKLRVEKMPKKLLFGR